MPSGNRTIASEAPAAAGGSVTRTALHAGQSCRHATAWVAAAAVLSGAPAAAAGTVDAKALLSAADNRGEWLTHGRTHDEQRFSPLEQINTGNVKRPGLAWFADQIGRASCRERV